MIDRFELLCERAIKVVQYPRDIFIQSLPINAQKLVFGFLDRTKSRLDIGSDELAQLFNQVQIL